MQDKHYSVGWICALAVELAAAKLMLDEHHDKAPQTDHDTNAYTFGRIGKHNVVITCLPAGVIGTASAANVAKQLHSSFPSISIGLMVGVGGGVPGPDNDIRLGDVVISKPKATFGGVVQYDLGKTLEGGRFQREGHLNRPPDVLLSAIGNLEAEHMLRNHRLDEFFTDAIDKHPETRAHWLPPGTEHDHLYQASYDHHANDDKVCARCDKDKVVAREKRDHSTPHLHYGLIASGNQVIRDGKTRDDLGKQLGAICFEMEAAGLMGSFPCLVIRGVCDYADSHKNKRWQPYAAAMAAAYGKELLYGIPQEGMLNATTKRKYEEFFQDQQQCTKSEAERTQNLIHAVETEGRFSAHIDRVLQSLNFSTMNAREEEIEDPFPRTLDWVFEPAEKKSRPWHDLLEWTKHGKDLYWINGHPGSGKSTLMSFITQEPRFREALKVWARDKQPNLVKFFFWRAGTLEQKSKNGLLRSAVFQLLSAYPELASLIVSHSASVIPVWTENRLQSALSMILDETSASAKVCFAVDGLDEFAGDEDSQESLIELIENLSMRSNVKFLVSSRPHPILYEAFFAREGLRLQDLNAKSIRMYVEGVFFKDKQIARHHASSESSARRVQNLIKDVAEKSDGVFLWVRLAVQDLKSGFRAYDSLDLLEKRLTLLERSLDGLFAQLLERIHKVHKADAANLFSIVLFWERAERLKRCSSLTLLPIALMRDAEVLTVFEQLLKSEGSEPESIRTIHERLKALEVSILAQSAGLLAVEKCDCMGFHPKPSFTQYLYNIIQPDDELKSNVNPAYVATLGYVYRHYSTHTRVRFFHRTVIDFFESSDVCVNLLKQRTMSDVDMIQSLIKAQQLLIKGSMMLLRQIVSREVSTTPLGEPAIWRVDTDLGHNIQCLVSLIEQMQISKNIEAAKLEFMKSTAAIRYNTWRTLEDIKSKSLVYEHLSIQIHLRVLEILLSIQPDEFLLGGVFVHYELDGSWILDYITLGSTASIQSLMQLRRLSPSKKLVIGACNKLLELGTDPNSTSSFTSIGRLHCLVKKQSLWESFLGFLKCWIHVREVDLQIQKCVSELIIKFISSGADMNVFLGDVLNLNYKGRARWDFYTQTSVMRVIEDYFRSCLYEDDGLIDCIKASGALSSLRIIKIKGHFKNEREGTSRTMHIECSSCAQVERLVPYLQKHQFSDWTTSERRRIEYDLDQMTWKFWEENAAHHQLDEDSHDSDTLNATSELQTASYAESDNDHNE